MNKTIHSLTTVTIKTELSRKGRQAIHMMWRMEQEHDVMGMLNHARVRQHQVASNGKAGRQKERVVGPVMGRAGCPGRELDCLKPAGTGKGLR